MVAEWWLHSRPHTAGHQLHYDTDEQRLRSGAGVHCPLVSTVLYLSGAAAAGPTVVLDQVHLPPSPVISRHLPQSDAL